MLKRLFLLLLLVVSSTVYADNTEKVVNDVMNAYMEKNDVPGAAVIVYKDGKPSAYYFGYADRETKKPVTKDTIFELGSITKLMTTLLMAQEVDFAKIKLDESVNKYIPTLPATFSNITMRSLATHTSGLPFKPPADIKTRAEWEKYAAEWKPDHKVDADYIYSNLGIGLIGQALETVTHQNFNQLYRTKILAPLGMQPIALTVPQKLDVFYAKGYNVDGNAVPPETLGLFPAAGDMKASVEDMGKFLAASIGLPGTPESIFYPIRMTQTAYVAVGETDLGLAWQIHEIDSKHIKSLLKASNELGLDIEKVSGVYAEPKFDGNQLIDKSGTTSGFKTYIAVIPSKKTGVVVLTNRRTNGNQVVAAGREILFKVNGIS
jgi:beta-lactamase class C